MKRQRTAQEKFEWMTTTSIPKLVVSLSIPTIISMIVTSLYNMADTFFVGRIGTSATGGVGVVFSLMAVIQALGFTFGQGSGNYISRKLGAQDQESAEKMAATAFFSALGMGCIVTVVGLIFLDPLVRMLGATETILPYARSYARYILIGAPYMVASLVLNNQLRFQGSAFYSMIGITTGAIINIGLDPLFIFVFHMGIGGAALATIISQFISFLLLLKGTTQSSNIRIRLRNFSPTWRRYYEILRGGLPSFYRQGLASVATILLNVAARTYGDAAIAAMAIVSRVMMFAFSAVLGFGQGFQPVCGFNYGAQRYARVRRAFWFCIWIGLSLLTVFSIVGVVWAPKIIALFRREDAQVIAIGAKALRLQCLIFPLNTWVVLTNMLLQTIGKAAKASLVSLARQGIFFIPAILILLPLLGLLGIQLSQPIADGCSLLLTIPLGVSVLREMKRQEEERKLCPQGGADEDSRKIPVQAED